VSTVGRIVWLEVGWETSWAVLDGLGWALRDKKHLGTQPQSSTWLTPVDMSTRDEVRAEAPARPEPPRRTLSSRCLGTCCVISRNIRVNPDGVKRSFQLCDHAV